MTQDRVLWQTGDDLSAANLGLATYRQNRTNYVEQGMALSADWGDRRLYASPGIAFLRHDNRGVAVQSDNKQTSIPSSGTVTAYLVVDLDATDSVNLATGDPDPPRLAIGTVDADAESVEEINRFPRLRAREPDGEQDVVRQLELDGKADSPHDNAAHTETYAVDGDPQPPEQHGMGEHDDSVASSQALDAVDSDLQDHTDDETNPHAVTADQTGAPTAPVDTAELSEAAVTAAILAANAVESGKIAASAVGEDEIASGAVGREELMQALGTSQDSPISGTTHFEGVSADSADVTNDVNAGSVSAESLGGDLVDRVEDINHLEGNIYLTEEGAPDPTENDGDLWFEYESE